jgi:hypothetical protein
VSHAAGGIYQSDEQAIDDFSFFKYTSNLSDEFIKEKRN